MGSLSVTRVRTTVLRDSDTGEAVHAWVQGVYANSVPSAQYHYNVKLL